MNVPAFVLLSFAGWTVLTLFGSIGVYRWNRILTGRASISEWRADAPQGSERYQRAKRAHMICVENLPIFGALVVALMATGLQSPSVDALSIPSSNCSDWRDSGPLCSTTYECVGSAAFCPVLCVQIVCIMSIGAIIALSTIR